MTLSLPDSPSLDWLKKQAKRRLEQLRHSNPKAQLADAQFALAKEYGFPSWRALKAHIDLLGIDGQLVEAAKTGNVARLKELLDQHPEKLHLRIPPYEFTLLHAAAQHGQLAAVDLLLGRGLDANVREKGDNTYPMHWAAAAGRPDVVRRLIETGGEVVGAGDDHALEVIGWATCWDGANTPGHREVVQLLLEHGARHHIFSAIALDDAELVRRIVHEDPHALTRRRSHNEDNQLPLHFAVGLNRPEMVKLLVELGADPLGTDRSGYTAAAYATVPGVDRPVLEAVRRMTLDEVRSADNGRRPASARAANLAAVLALGDWDTAARLVRDNTDLVGPGASRHGLLHLMAKRGDLAAARWLLDHGGDPNARWQHWDADVTPLHMAALGGHADMARLLVDAGADPMIKDSKHDSDAISWAEFFGREDIGKLLTARTRKS